VVENWNSGNTVIFYGKDGDLTGPDREHAEVSTLALHLLQSALVHVVGWNNFDEFGNTANTTASTGLVNYGWLGGSRRAKSPTGLLLMGARVYNPATGTFTTSTQFAAATRTPTLIRPNP
jgi:hypothetical protein